MFVLLFSQCQCKYVAFLNIFYKGVTIYFDFNILSLVSVCHLHRILSVWLSPTQGPVSVSHTQDPVSVSPTPDRVSVSYTQDSVTVSVCHPHRILSVCYPHRVLSGVSVCHPQRILSLSPTQDVWVYKQALLPNLPCEVIQIDACFLRDDAEREITTMAVAANGEDEQTEESQPAPKKKVWTVWACHSGPSSAVQSF